MIGSWCNLGASTCNSNLKNNYSPVSLWCYESQDFRSTDEIFLGFISGDHAKFGIHSLLSTGTVVGTFASVFGGGLVPRHVPCFAWLDTGKCFIFRI